MGGRRSAATERVQGRITSGSKRPPHSHFSVSTAARRAPPRVHDHDATDGLMMGWVLGGDGNVAPAPFTVIQHLLIMDLAGTPLIMGKCVAYL